MYNGKFDPNINRACIAWNNGSEHRNANCHADGTCRFTHDKFDHYVSDNGPKGICKGKHKRSDCTNPTWCKEPVE